MSEKAVISYSRVDGTQSTHRGTHKNEDCVIGTAKNLDCKVQEGFGRVSGDTKSQVEGVINQERPRNSMVRPKSLRQILPKRSARAPWMAEDHIRHTIERRPYSTAFVALCVGWFIGRMGRRDQKPELLNVGKASAQPHASTMLVPSPGTVLCVVRLQRFKARSGFHHVEPMPPIPPANRSKKGRGSDPEMPNDKPVKHEHHADAAEEGETANIKQNTTNKGFFRGPPARLIERRSRLLLPRRYYQAR